MRRVLLGLLGVLVAFLLVPLLANVSHAASADRAQVSAPAARGAGSVTFKAWGIPRARVHVIARNDIELTRPLPFSTTQYLTGIDYTFATIGVEDTHGYRTVGCAIYVNGRLRSRDVSTFGYALCML
jgi:hypothetical protein